MITVEIVLFATLRCYNPHEASSEPFYLQLPSGSKIADLLVKLKIPPTVDS